MKKIAFSLALVSAYGLCLAQNHGNGNHDNSGNDNSKWNVYGNNNDADDVLGTTNAFPINFIVNSINKMTLDVNGNLQLSNLKSTNLANRILLTDPNGFISALPAGSTGQFLQSNGTWGNLPAANFLQSGSDIYLPTGSIGVGIAPSPGIKLDVIGNVRISNDLLVGGGIIITDKVQAATQIKGFDFKVDNTIQIATLAGTGMGKVYVDASGSLLRGPLVPATWECVPASPNWNIGGNNFNAQSFAGIFDANIGTCDAADFILKANNIERIWLKPDSKIGFGTSTPVEQFHFSGGTVRIDGSSGLFPPSDPTYNKALIINGDVSLANYAPVGGDPTNGLNGFEVLGNNQKPKKRGISMDAQPDGHLSFFINSGTVAGTNASFFFKNGALGGVNTQALVEITKFGALIVNCADSYALNMIDNNTPATTSGKSFFSVTYGGKTQIGFDKQLTGPHTDAMLTVGGTGKIVAKSCYIRILDWADEVFSSDYQLPNLYDIEAFYKTNKHLAEIPSEKEILEKGVDIGEMNRLLLKKVEELTLYIVDQNKRIDALEKNSKKN